MSAHDNALNHLTADLRKTASAVGRDVENFGSNAKDVAADVVGKIQKDSAMYYDQGMKKAIKLEKGLEKTVSENPLTSLLVAVGVGLVAGAFFNRR